MRRTSEPDQPTCKPSNPESATAEKALGLNQDITRRDFLNSALLASGGLLLHPLSPAELLAQQANQRAASDDDDWTGFGGVGDYASSNGNTRAVLEAGHRIRDKEFESLPTDAIETGEASASLSSPAPEAPAASVGEEPISSNSPDSANSAPTAFEPAPTVARTHDVTPSTPQESHV